MSIVMLQVSALRSCAKLLSSATNSDSSDHLKSRPATDSDFSVPLSRLDKSMYYGGSRAVFGKSLLRSVCNSNYQSCRGVKNFNCINASNFFNRAFALMHF